MLRQPVFSSNRRFTSPGNGAPPDMQNFREEKSRLSMPGEVAIALKIEGTAGKKVGRCLLIDFSTSPGTNFGCRRIFIPAQIEQFITTVMANTWKRGSTPTIVSFPGSPIPPTQEAVCCTLT